MNGMARSLGKRGSIAKKVAGKCFGSPKGRRRHGGAGDVKAFAAAVESLEQKQLLTVIGGIDVGKIGGVATANDPPPPVPTVVTATFQNGVLRVDGTDAADNIWVVQRDGMMYVAGVKIQNGAAQVDGVQASAVQQVVVVANGGNDMVSLDTWGMPGLQPITAQATVYGGAGDDFIQGGAGVDYLSGGDGNDTIYGGAGNDVLIGGPGQDALYGQAGNDTLWGEGGNDWLDGGDGDDWLYAGDGWDRLYGGAGNDWMYGQAGPDILCGGDGVDALFGGDGNDALYGQGGDDWMYGNAGQNALSGGSGVDRVYADHAGDWVMDAEATGMWVPSDAPQNDGWSCGPNTASRILRSYGYTSATYDAVRSAAQDNSLLSDFGLGTTTSNLVETMRKWKSDTVSEVKTSLQRVLDVVGSGKPVAALISVGTDSFWGISYPQLHWIAVTGVDLIAQTLTYTDTNGHQSQIGFDAFYKKWNWSAGTIAGAVLDVVGVKNRTIVY